MIKKNFVLFLGLFLLMLSCGEGRKVNILSDSSSQVTETSERTALESLEDLSFEEVRTYFPDQKDFVSEEESEFFVERFLQKVNRKLSESDKKKIKEKLFGKGTGTPLNTSIHDLYQNIVFENLRQRLSSLTDTKLTQLLKQMSQFLDQVPAARGSLDKNGDGKINAKDYVSLFDPQYSNELNEEDIKKQYYYWSYFIDIEAPFFKDKMWKSKSVPVSSAITPPKQLFLDHFLKNKRAVILDFKRKLGLQKIDQGMAQQFLNQKARYKLPFKIDNNFSDSIYQTVVVGPDNQSQAMVIDKIAIVSSDSSKEEVYFMIRNNPLQNVLLLTPALWIHFKTPQQKTSFYFNPFHLGIRKAMAQEEYGQLTWEEALEYLMIQIDKENIERKIEDLHTEQARRNFSADVTVASFVPPAPPDLSSTTQNIQREVELIQTEYQRLVDLAKRCEEGRGFRGSNLCNLKKLYLALEKLEARLNLFIEVNLLTMKDHLNQHYDWLRERRQLEQAEGIVKQHYDETMRLMLGLKALELVLGGFKRIITFVLKEAVEAVAGPMIESTLESTLEGLASLLDYTADNLNISGVEDIVSAFRTLADKCRGVIQEARLSKKGLMGGVSLKLFLAFGVETLEGLIRIYYERLLKPYKVEWFNIYRKQMEQKAIVDSLNNLDVFLREQKRLIRKMTILDQIDTSYQEKIIRRQARDACEQSYEGEILNLEVQLRNDTNAQLEKLIPFQQKFNDADFEFKMWKLSCKNVLRDIQLALKDEAEYCSPQSLRFDQRMCDTARQNTTFQKESYFQRLKCADENAPPIQGLKTAQSHLDSKKHEIGGIIFHLKENYSQAIQQAQQRKEQCLKDIEPNCDLALAPLQTFLFPYNTSDAPWLHVVEIFTQARSILQSLQISCEEAESLVRGMFPIDGRLSCPLNHLAKNHVYLWFDHPLQYTSAFGDEVEIDFETTPTIPDTHIRHLESGTVAAFYVDPIYLWPLSEPRRSKEFQIRIFKTVNRTKTWPIQRRLIGIKNFTIEPIYDDQGRTACDPSSQISLHVTHQYRKRLRLHELMPGGILNSFILRDYLNNDPETVKKVKNDIKFGITPSSYFNSTRIEGVSLTDKTRNITYPAQGSSDPPYLFNFNVKFEPNTEYEITIQHVEIGVKKNVCTNLQYGCDFKSYDIGFPGSCLSERGYNPYGCVTNNAVRGCTYSITCHTISIPAPVTIPFKTVDESEFYTDTMGDE